MDSNADEGLNVAGEDDKKLAKEIADEVVPAFVSALKKAKEGDISERELVELSNNFKHAQDDIGTLKKVVYEQHEPVILWSRNFMDSYRKIVTAVIISGLITLAGFLVQMYYLLQKSK